MSTIDTLCAEFALMPLFDPETEKKLAQGWLWSSIFWSPEESYAEYEELRRTQAERDEAYAAARSAADAVHEARIAEAEAAVDDPDYWVKKSSTAPIIIKRRAPPASALPERDVPPFPYGRCTLIAKNLPRDIDVNELYTIFEPYGPICDIYIPKNADRSSPYFGTIKGFAKIQFLSPDDSAAAYNAEWSLLSIRGNNIAVEPANADSAPPRIC